MQLGGDERAVSEVLGAILIFGILVVALGVYQSVAVPNANEDVELKHNQEVQGDMIDLRNDIRQSASQGTGTSATIDLGASYPPRIIATNPESGSGSLRVADSGQVLVRNATSTDDDVADYWDGNPKDYDTSTVVFAPNYNYFRNAPETRIEGATVYNSFEDGDPIPLSGQNVVDGREISLVTIEGDLSRSQATALSVDVDPVSVDESTVTLEANGSDEFVNVTIPTRAEKSLWIDQLLSGQFDDGPKECEEIDGDDDNDSASYIKCYEWESGSPNLLNLTMEADTTYKLNVARVRVGSASAGEQTPEYLTVTRGDGITVPENGARDLVFEVRDKYDNPIPNTNVTVGLNASSGSLSAGSSSGDVVTAKTDEDGELAVTYLAPGTALDSPERVVINSTVGDKFDSYDDANPTDATVNLDVINASKINRTDPLFNDPNGIRITDSEFKKADCVPGGGANLETCRLDVKFKNNGSTKSEITDLRLTFFKADNFNQGNSANGGALKQVATNNTYVLKDGYSEFTLSLNSTEDETVTFYFCEETCDPGENEISIESGDFFVIEVLVNQTERQTFIFGPSDGT